GRRHTRFSRDWSSDVCSSDLILLLRLVAQPFEVGGYTIPPGKLVGASPAVSNRLPEAFDEPDRFDPSRYVEPRQDDLDNPWNWIDRKSVVYGKSVGHARRGTP